MAPEGVRTGVRRISDSDRRRLAAAERALTDGMSDARRGEFASGRALLHDLIGTSDPILRSAEGAPILPSGFRGTLAHDRTHVVAAVTTRSDVSAIGIDIEPTADNELSVDEAALIVRPDDRAKHPLQAFVAKEATYKAWSSLGGHLLDHHEVHILVDNDGFRATVRAGRAGGRPAPVADTFDGVLGGMPHHRLALVVVFVPTSAANEPMSARAISSAPRRSSWM